MPRKVAKSSSSNVKNEVLKLSEITGVTSFTPPPVGERSLPEGFARYETKKPGKVSPFSSKKGGSFTYEYPKGSPFKMVSSTKTRSQVMYQDILEAARRGLIEWSQVNFPDKVVKHLQKNLIMLEETN